MISEPDERNTLHVTKILTVPIDQVEYVKELYPRLKPDDSAIERYRDAIDNLPPITVARGRVLVDGYHRWQAHRREDLETIQAEDLGDLTDIEIVKEAVRRNASHGLQLESRDKMRMADHLYRQGVQDSGELMSLLSLTEKSLEKALRDAKRDEKQAQQDKAWDLWLECWPQPKIADEVGVDKATVMRWLQNRTDTEMQPPESRQHFDVWSFHKADADAGSQSYFGAIPPQVVENLLWLYTDPGDVVVDLFAGSGTTIDVAKAMGRRVWASDRLGDTYSPHLTIHKHNIDDGWPEAAPAKAKLLLLDPPYWRQAKGRYSQDIDDLGNCPLDVFYGAWSYLLKAALDRAERVAYIISPTQNEDGTVVDHATDMLRAAWDLGYTVERRIIVTYQTQQATGQQVEWARENRRLLKLYRDLVVMST